ncbi:Bax inhibitor-1 family protein [Algimonas porphyrae]|uniref:Membrane protein n=1 Tax=Algimonas porphyrae TaxID=1128113 RepID=A0ABQ5UZ74_9PROT|nr:Bax inhibitor-1 family protein [Algimonas porphyrae]GLQ20583.1 membrane protein [Algimonas porphyrae]
MNDYNRGVIGGDIDTDVGLKSFMLGTYRWMALAMGVTATVAFMVGQAILADPSLLGIIYNPIVAIVSFGIIVFGFGAVGRKLPSMSMGGVLAFLFGFAAFMGVLMSAYASLYNPMIVAKIFFMTVAMFAALSMFGYTTGFNLNAVIKYAMAAFLAYIVIGFVGMFVPALSVFGGGLFGTIINVVALGAIALITAWETQTLKRIYYGTRGDTDMMNKASAFGAASLLLAFINMFTILMNLFGRE